MNVQLYLQVHRKELEAALTPFDVDDMCLEEAHSRMGMTL
jgi:hypothetical protein